MWPGSPARAQRLKLSMAAVQALDRLRKFKARASCIQGTFNKDRHQCDCLQLALFGSFRVPLTER